MTKDDIYSVFPTQSGEVEVIDRNVSGSQLMYCPDCQILRRHQLVAVSSIRGHIYMCTFCGRVTAEGGFQ